MQLPEKAILVNSYLIKWILFLDPCPLVSLAGKYCSLIKFSRWKNHFVPAHFAVKSKKGINFKFQDLAPWRPCLWFTTTHFNFPHKKSVKTGSYKIYFNLEVVHWCFITKLYLVSILGFHVMSYLSGVNFKQRHLQLEWVKMFTICVGLVLESKYVQFRIINSLLCSVMV